MKKLFWLGMLVLTFALLVNACQGTGKHPVMTAWPKYIPVQLPALSLVGIHAPAPESCQVRAVNLIGAWVNAGTPEQDAFPFTDINGKSCQGTFDADVLNLFIQANFWYAGAPSCRTCHGPDISNSYARMDLSSYQGILAGSARESADSKGNDILGGGNWEQAELYTVLTKGEMPPNRPATVNPEGPLISAGIAQ